MNNTSYQIEIPSLEKKRVIFIDASALMKSACNLRLYRTVVDGYYAGELNVDMVYGTAFHAFMETLERSRFQPDGTLLDKRNVDIGPAIQVAHKVLRTTPCVIKDRKDHLNISHLQLICRRYHEEIWLTDSFNVLWKNGKPCVEIKFAIPFYVGKEIIVVLSGTIDRLGRVGRNGVYLIKDFKTTSSYKIDEYLQGYKLSPQLMIYNLAVRYFSQDHPEFEYKAEDSVFKMMYDLKVGACIDGIFLKPDIDKCEFKQSQVFYFTEQQIDEIEACIYEKCMKLEEEYINRLQLRDGMLLGQCKVFEMCPFFGVCSAPDDKTRDIILSSNFKTKTYDPRAFRD